MSRWWLVLMLAGCERVPTAPEAQVDQAQRRRMAFTGGCVSRSTEAIWAVRQDRTRALYTTLPTQPFERAVIDGGTHSEVWRMADLSPELVEGRGLGDRVCTDALEGQRVRSAVPLTGRMRMRIVSSPGASRTWPIGTAEVQITRVRWQARGAGRRFWTPPVRFMVTAGFPEWETDGGAWDTDTAWDDTDTDAP